MTHRSEGQAHSPIDQALRALIRSEEHHLAVEARRRRGDLRDQAAEPPSIGGVLAACLGSDALVSVHTAAGDHPRSAVIEVGRDYVALRDAQHTVRLLPFAAVSAVRSAEPRRAWRTGLPAPSALTLAERLAELGRLGSRVRIAAGPLRVAGRLGGAGADVIVIEDEDGTDAYVATATLTEVSIAPGDQSSASAPRSAEPTTSG